MQCMRLYLHRLHREPKLACLRPSDQGDLIETVLLHEKDYKAYSCAATTGTCGGLAPSCTTILGKSVMQKLTTPCLRQFTHL